MNRTIKFRAWDKVLGNMIKDFVVIDGADWNITKYEPGVKVQREDFIVEQFTGLTDKNEPSKEVYEHDIVSLDGKVIGNSHENSNLLKDKANLLIQGFGTGAWLTTYAEAVERGCHDAK